MLHEGKTNGAKVSVFRTSRKCFAFRSKKNTKGCKKFLSINGAKWKKCTLKLASHLASIQCTNSLAIYNNFQGNTNRIFLFTKEKETNCF